MNKNIFIFTEEAHQFEPYKTFSENYMFWFKKYMYYIFGNQSTRLVHDIQLHKKLVSEFISKNELKELRDVINTLSRNGFKSPKTYFNPLCTFFEFLSSNGAKTLKDIKTSSLRHFFTNELDEYSFSHKKNIYTAIKSFLLYIEENNIINKSGDNYIFKLKKDIVKSLGKEKKVLSYLEPKTEYFQFLEEIDKYSLWQKNKEARNKLMLKILLLTGIRVNELVRIKQNGIKINGNQMEIEIIGKGNKKRYTYLEDELSVHYYKLLIEQHNSSEYLFSAGSNFINERYLNDLVKVIMKSAGIPLKEKNGPHMLRHSCSTWLSVVGGFDIAKLQIFMAHEDIRTTKKYTHLDAEVVQSISSDASKMRKNNIRVFKEFE